MSETNPYEAPGESELAKSQTSDKSFWGKVLISGAIGGIAFEILAVLIAMSQMPAGMPWSGILELEIHYWVVSGIGGVIVGGGLFFVTYKLFGGSNRSRRTPTRIAVAIFAVLSGLLLGALTGDPVLDAIGGWLQNVTED